MKECYKYTALTCDECGEPIIQDIFKSEYYCLHCGLLQDIIPYDPNIINTI